MRNTYLIGKAFNSFLLASLLTVAATQVSAMIDGMMLSYFIGEYAMSSVNICRPVMQLLFSLCMLMGAGSSMLVGMEIGNHRRTDANRIFTAVIAMVVVTGGAILTAGLTSLRPLVALLCSDESLRPVTGEFLGVTLYGAVFFMLSVTLEMFVAVDGSPKRVTAAVLACAVTNLALDYVFISLVGWGVSGAAWATVIAYAVSVLVLLPHFLRPGTLRLAFRRCLATIPKSLGAGLPFGLATILIAVQLWGNNNIAMAYFGQDGIIAISVCFYLLGLSMIVLSGTLKAFQPVASILKGAGDETGVLMVIRRAYRFMFICLIVFAAPMVLCPQYVAMAFGINDPGALAMTGTAVTAFSANIMLQCVIYLLIPIYQLYGNKAMANFVSVGQSLAPVFGMWLLAEEAPALVWWGFALGQAVIAVLIVVFASVVRIRRKNLIPLFLVPRDESVERFETSIPPRTEALGELLADVDTFLKKHFTDTSLVMHIEVSSEELLKNIMQHGYGGQGGRHFIDYRMAVHPDHVSVVITDDARAFNLTDYKEETGYGLLLVRRLTKDIRYDYLFHQNMTTMTFLARQEKDS